MAASSLRLVLVDLKMSYKRKQALDLEQKISIINDVEVGKKQSAVAVSLNPLKQTVTWIWQNRDKLRQAFESCANNNHKRLRTATFDDIEEALLK